MKNVTAICHAAIFGALTVAAPAPVSAGEPADSGNRTAIYDTKTGKYCVKEAFTGSRMPKSVCRTREQWADEGVVMPQKSEAGTTEK